MKKFLVTAVVVCMIAGCGTMDVFERTVFFPKHEWPGSEKPSFYFQVEDTAARYHIFVVFRHEDAYHFNNLWLNIITRAPGDTAVTQQVDIKLADNTRGWLGTGMDDVYDHRTRITQSPVKLRKGAYTFTLQQTMREDPLQSVLNAGIRVEKVQP
ncbi:gliding motility lipoprotein GldH [Sediminibacterium soli]|uniref:gliding motility lipoprotein GldH n=1 Tax=Sediminibacterium soli TaxID=2698829 RepID=UPI00137B0F54|nr:gliding motility lipoprotein GldH [Sediminibacterium soli]NCI45342.1 gliding motility lipoprotein GldH [Sediminibacterium soli]